MAAAVDPHEEGIVLFFFTLFFHKFFSRWWIRTSCLVVCRYHHMAAAVDLHEDSSDFADMKHVAAAVDPHEEGIVFFFFSDFADMKMKLAKAWHAGRL